MHRDFSQRFGFLVNEVGRLYGRRFDQLARQRLGLSRAQCRLLGAVAAHAGPEPLSQVELAQKLDLTAMAVATLCDRMEALGWVRRVPNPNDRRANGIELEARAGEALDAALALGDRVQAQALAGLSEPQRQQLLALLRQVHANLQALGDADLASPADDVAVIAPAAGSVQATNPARSATDGEASS
jgi:DNA-binding MarR family transcriptional regulator